MATVEQIALARTMLPGLPASITDDQIGDLIDNYAGSVIDAAIALADSAASLYASKADIKVGSISISNSQKAKAWQALKDNLIKRKLTGAGGGPAGSASLAAAGIAGASLTGEAVPTQFWVGQFDNPPLGVDGSGW